jgi:GT2 family glycosyltransferase
MPDTASFDDFIVPSYQRAFSSPLVDRRLLLASCGGTVRDTHAIDRYLSLPVDRRPDLSVYFDREWYYFDNPDVAEAGSDPLYHFLTYGLKELRSPHPLIDLRYIDASDPAHFGGSPTDFTLLDILDLGLADPSPYFSISHYQSQRQAGETIEEAPLRHFLTVGLKRGCQPHPLLDVFWYAGRYPDAPRDPYEALRHFAMIGDREGRSSNECFNGARYFKRYPDIAAAKVPALKHFLINGKSESRQAVVERFPIVEESGVGRPTNAKAATFEIEPTVVRQQYEELRNKIASEARRNIEFFAPVPAPVMAVDISTPERLDEVLARLAFPAAINPRVSILIPVFNELPYTLECLLSLQKFASDEAFEVVIADDASTDPQVLRLAEIPNLKVIRQPANLGFLRNCNAAYASTRGEYILLLNNDAQFLGPVAHSLMACLDNDPSIGGAGPKMIYPNGRLQEAGCSIDSRGDTQMIGLFRDPDEPSANYARDTHYISGAALMVRRSLLGDTLFDERYVPAYCEDTDICLRIWSQGSRVRYCPDAVVAHHLSVSTGKQSVARRLQLVSRNRAKLEEKWKDLLVAMNKVRTIAFYLPQFHPFAENDAWWGRGFTEWTNVSRAQPSYSFHYQPHLPSDMGFYDLRLTEIFGEQARLAARYGLAGFCVYYYNFDGRRVLEKAFEKLLDRPEIPFPFCICWANENWTRHWDGGDRHILLGQSYSEESFESVVADAIRYAQDPRYLQVNGKPLFLLYRPGLLPEPKNFADLCRRRFREAGFPDVHLVYVESMEMVAANLRPADIGFDACVEFPPQGRAVPSTAPAEVVKKDWAGYRYDYAETAQAFINRPRAGYARYPAVFPSWDNTPRQPLKGTSFEGVSPALFQAYLEAKLDEVQTTQVGDERLLFINAWNEWAEGAHLEPDQAYGHRWLEGLRGAAQSKGFIL